MFVDIAKMWDISGDGHLPGDQLRGLRGVGRVPIRLRCVSGAGGVLPADALQGNTSLSSL